MSLSSLLRGSQVDKDLDALFSTKIAKAATPIAIPGAPAKKRKVADNDDADPRPKKSKTPKDDAAVPAKPKKTVRIVEDSPKEEKKSKKKVKKIPQPLPVDDEDNSDVEEAYLSKGLPEQDEDEDMDPLELVHESLTGKKRDRGAKVAKAKYTPPEETSEQRDARTVFVGNLSVEVAQKKPLSKQLQRHILNLIPGAKIDSIRFRSIPFQRPTAPLPDDEEGATKGGKKPVPIEKRPESRPHDRERINTWRDKRDDEDGKSDEKKFLNPGQKKRIAFINQEFHASADTANAYIVFAHPVPVQAARASNVAPPPETMDPYQAALLAAEKCDGTLFMERMIRVDVVGKAGDAVVASGDDPKLTVFVGNLDFASKEEDLRVFFEGVVSAERGPPPAGTDDEGKPTGWVHRVRIVRDKETQLGKGFAYIQFSERGCVDEVLALEEDKLRFAKRKLRVQRCKTVPGVKLVVPPPAPKTKTPRPAIVVPKGDPTLGSKIASLGKEERKEYKSGDADRVARRLAKKKARVALEHSGVKAQVKDRERVRKTGPHKNEGAFKRDVGAKKGRVRSDKAMSKRNGKKSGPSAA